MRKYIVWVCVLLMSICAAEAQAAFEVPSGMSVNKTELPSENVPEQTPEQTTDHFFKEFLNMLSVLGMLLLFLLVVAWVVKRMFNTRMEQINNSSLIKVTERRQLSPKTIVYVLDILGKRYAVAESHNGLTSLGELDPRSRSFSDVMEKGQ